MSTTHFLGRQELAIRGHSMDDISVSCLKFQVKMKGWLKQEQEYTNQDIRNEYLQLTAHDELRHLSALVATAKYFSIIGGQGRASIPSHFFIPSGDYGQNRWLT